MKPFARLETTDGAAMLYCGNEPCLPALGKGQEHVLEHIGNKINTAHRARVRAELEAFKDKIISLPPIWTDRALVAKEDIDAIDIDAFMDRDG